MLRRLHPLSLSPIWGALFRAVSLCLCLLVSTTLAKFLLFTCYVLRSSELFFCPSDRQTDRQTDSVEVLFLCTRIYSGISRQMPSSTDSPGLPLLLCSQLSRERRVDGWMDGWVVGGRKRREGQKGHTHEWLAAVFFVCTFLPHSFIRPARPPTPLHTNPSLSLLAVAVAVCGVVGWSPSTCVSLGWLVFLYTLDAMPAGWMDGHAWLAAWLADRVVGQVSGCGVCDGCGGKAARSDG